MRPAAMACWTVASETRRWWAYARGPKPFRLAYLRNWRWVHVPAAVARRSSVRKDPPALLADHLIVRYSEADARYTFLAPALLGADLGFRDVDLEASAGPGRVRAAHCHSDVEVYE